MLRTDNITLQVGIGPDSDVVDADTPFELSITERLGNNVPEAEMKLPLAMGLGQYLETELMGVNFAFGFSSEETVYSRWQIVGFTESMGVTTFALTTDRAYINDTVYRAYSGNSISVMKEVAGKYYDIENADKESTFQVTASNEKKTFSGKNMKWIHSGTSVRDFVDMLWLYSWHSDKTLIVPAITAGISKHSSNKAGTFRLIDLNNNKNVITLSKDRSPDKDLVVVTGDIKYAGFSGKYNNLIGNRNDNSFNVSDSTVTDKTVEPPSPVFKGGFSEKVKNDGKRCVKIINSSPVILSDNVHPHFSTARAKNLTRLAKFGGFSKRVQVADYDIAEKKHKNIVIGDIVCLNIPYAGTNTISDIHSGYYVVAETVQRITTEGITKSYTKELVLRRDASLAAEI
jgi:hypothetical protein